MPSTALPRLTGPLRRVNLVLAALLVGLVLAYVVVSFAVDMPPYDYWLLMNSADYFCFQQEAFVFGTTLRAFYPAPFYTTFCVPYHFAEPILRIVWMIAPIGLALWLARGRAAVLVYPPLAVLTLLGQSSWLLLPAFMVAAQDRDDRSVPGWWGLLLVPGVFKPHVILPIWVWLGWRWLRRREWRALAFWGAGVALTVVPAFMIRPTWVIDWLPNGRGFEPVNLASLAMIPVQLFGMGFAPGAAAQLMVYGTALVLGGAIYGWLRWRRGQLALYDWVLVFFLVSPFLNDYDLVVLLPFIANHRRRLPLALAAGLIAWVFAMLSGAVSPHYRFSMSLLITLALLVDRLWHVPARSLR
jgi:hypothetical protein